MKKLFTTAIAICLLLSFSLTSFASVSVTHIYKGKSLIEGDLNEYIFTFAKYDGDETPEAFGLIIDGEKYPLEESGIPSAQTMKRFGIGIADAENKLTDVFKATPYVTVNGEDILGEEQIIDKAFLYEKMESFFAGYASDVICDDTNSKTNRFNDWYTPTGIYMQTNIHNGLGFGYNEALNRALIQLDLTKFDGVDATKPVILSVVGRAQYSAATSSAETLPESMTVNAYGFYEFDWSKSAPGYVWPEEGEEDTTEPVYEWSESSVNPSAGYIGPRLEEIVKMPLLDSFTVEVPENTENKTSGDVVAPVWTTYEVDVKDIVAAALKAGKTKATIVLLADNSEREKIPHKDADGNTLARDEVILNMGTTENTTESRRPKVSYYRFNEEYVNLEKIEVNGVAVSGFDAETTEYTVGYTKGEEIPTVTAKTVNEESRTVITQATAENKTAVIKVYDEQNIRSKTYKVNFVSSIPSSSVETKSAITADAHSRVSDKKPTVISMDTNLYNGVPYTSGWESTLKRGYMQISVSELKDIDLSKNVYLNITAQTTLGANYKTELYPKSLNVNVHAAMKSEFEWNETTAAAVTANTFGPNITQMKALPLVSVITVSEESYNAGYMPYQIDITSAIKKAIETKEEYVTLMFSADNSERNTEELIALKNANGNNRDNVTFTILTKEREVVSQQPFVTYSKYDSAYTNLSGIAIDGEAIADFDAATFTYTAKMEDGAEIPVVSATAFDSDATVTVEQPSEANGYVAIITVTNEGLTEKTYKVVFETAKASVLTAVENGITDDATSRVGYSKPDAITFFTNLNNGAGPGWEGTLRRGYVQIDLTGFADRDTAKNVYLNITEYVTYSAERRSENAPSEMKIDVYGIGGSEFVWNEEAVKDLEDSSFGPNIKTTTALPVLDSYTVAIPAPEGDEARVTTPSVQRAVDITKIVNSAIAAGETKATVIFMADNTSRAQYPSTLPNDEINYTVFSKEDATRAPFLSYYKFDSKYTDLASIEINGEAIADFDAADFEYESSFEEIDGVPAVTATAADKSAVVTVDQATEANGYVATITVANEGVTSKLYKVTFTKKASSSEVTILSAITADAHSRVGERNPTNIAMSTNLYNGVAYAAGLESTLKRGYIQVSLAELENIDLTKNVYLNIKASSSYDEKHITEYCPSEFNVNVYAAMKSEFSWNEETAAAVTVNTFGPNLTQMQALPLVTVLTVAKPVEDTNSGYQAYSINITEAIRTAKAANEDYVTFMFSADNSTRNTPELQALKAENSNNRDNLTFTILTKEYTVENMKPSVTYFAYDKAE